HRYRPTSVVVRQFYRYPRRTLSVIMKKPFQRVVRDICQNVLTREGTTLKDARWQTEAFETLQEAAEDYLIGLFQEGNLRGKGVPISAKDWESGRRLRGQ
ncbi:histone H3, partial [Gaertneriomyces semiglobifer]